MDKKQQNKSKQKVSQIYAAQQKQESEEETPTPKRNKRFDTMLAIANELQGINICPFEVKLEKKVTTITNNSMVTRPAIINEENKTIKEVPRQAIEGIINRFALRNELQCDAAMAKAIFDLWLNTDTGIHEDNLKTIGTMEQLTQEKNQASNQRLLARHRLNRPLEKGNTPIFDEFCNRVNGKMEFMQFIGSLIHDNSDRSQYLWIYGDGANGKSSILEWLRTVFKDTYANLEPPKMGREQFWKSELVGKRIIAFPDCAQTKFVTSGFFKNISGDEYHSIEQKFAAPYQAKINCKFIFMSNQRPEINDSKSELRRILFAEVAPIENNNSLISKEKYVEKLTQETYQILEKCNRAYLEGLEKHGYEIQRTTEAKALIEDLLEDKNDTYRGIFERLFNESEGHDVLGSEFNMTLKDFGIRSDHELGKFKAWMVKNTNCSLFRRDNRRWVKNIRIGV